MRGSSGVARPQSCASPSLAVPLGESGPVQWTSTGQSGWSSRTSTPRTGRWGGSSWALSPSRHNWERTRTHTCRSGRVEASFDPDGLQR